MHYVGHAVQCFDYYSATVISHNMSQVVDLLAEAAPQSINVEDEEEMNPIEVAITNGASIKVIKCMQRASRRDWRARRRTM